jgi:hypothetical protein
MKTVFFLILSLAALAVVRAVFIFDVFTESGGHASDSYSLKAPLASRGMTREEYISYLLKTEKHDNPELAEGYQSVHMCKCAHSSNPRTD